VLESEMGRLWEKPARDKIEIDLDAGLRTLRHSFLTEAGEYTVLKVHAKTHAAGGAKS
jgi:hypothetical protein